MTNAKKVTAKKLTAKPTAINSITAQGGAIAITVQTKASAKLKSYAPLVSAMNVVGEETSPELLSRLPTDTVAFRVFSSQVMSTAQLFSWFDENQASLKRTTKGGNSLLNVSGAYCAAFGIVHDRAVDGPLKAFPFYKRLSNALQQWAKKRKGFETRASGSISDAVASYLDKKLADDAAALSDSLTAWVLKHEDILVRIKKAV